jgi:hypothetical protein
VAFGNLFPPDGQNIQLSPLARFAGREIKPGRPSLLPGILTPLNQLGAIKGPHFTHGYIATGKAF